MYETMQDLEVLEIDDDLQRNKPKASPKVTISGQNKDVYEGTLASMLNQDPKLSHDR